MQPVAVMTFKDNRAYVKITNAALGDMTEVVYVWTTPEGEWLRVGTSRAPLKKRLQNYASHISRALEGKNSPTPLSEAQDWRKLIKKHKQLIALAHQPPYTNTIAGKVRPYLDIERVLISEKRPPLNRSHR